METVNNTLITEFILLGFPELHGVRMAFFAIVLTMYLLSVAGNCLIITVVFLEPKLHMPMYFFLSNFSLGELCSTTVVVPKMLTNILLDQNTICFACCMIQVFLMFSLGNTQFFNLTIMSFDHYMAICKPFLYNSKMTNRICFQMAMLSWAGGFTTTLCQVVIVWNYAYCRHNVINHICCDIGPILKLACADTTVTELIGLFLGAIFMWGSFIFSLVSYASIIYTILQIPSVSGRSKAFSTCSSHLTLVTIFYGIMFFMYLRPPTQTDSQINKVVFLVMIVVLPTLSPFIFTIRNNDFKTAMNKLAMNRRSYIPPSVVLKLMKWRPLSKWLPRSQ